MERWAGRVALVTGASVGIGAAITRSLVRHGMIVVACARGVEKIQAIKCELEAESASGKLHPIQCDLRKKDEIAAMFEEIKKEFRVVHVCINNAAVAYGAKLVTGDPDDWQEPLDSISPGVVKTEMAARKARQDPAECTFYDTHPSIKAEDVANQVIHVLQQPSYLQIHEILLRPIEQKI